MSTESIAQPNTDFLRYSHSIGICVMEGRGFMFPVDTALGKDGRMHTVSRAWVNASSNLRVTMYDIESEYYGVYGEFGEGLGEFRWPAGMAVDSQGNVYMSDEQTQRINIYSGDGSAISHWGVFGDKDGQFDRPSGIDFDPEDNLYVSDSMNNRIQKFSKDGNFQATFEIQAGDTNKLNRPWGVTFAPDRCVYVADWGNDRICKFTEQGTFVRSFGKRGRGDGEFRNPSSVAVDSDGYIYVADWANERIQVLDRNGDFVAKYRGEATVSKWAQEFLDSNVEEAEPRSRSNLEPDPHMFGGDPHEESAHIEKYFWGPTSIKIDRAGRIFVTESNRHRIQIYERNA